MKQLLLFLIIPIILTACVGKESQGIDKIPPEKPTMIPHLGDSGDSYNGINNYSFYGFTDLEENGIDALTDGNKIKIEWEHLLDNDIDYVRIHRFSEYAYLADTLSFSSIIDSIDYVGVDYYRDEFIGEYNVINKSWFYFIEPFDVAGNSTLSDTVCYHLLTKPVIQTPAEISEVNTMSGVVFNWELTNAQYYKILVFNTEREIVWSYRPLDLEETSIQYSGSALPAGDYIFRIDAFGYNTVSTPINDKTYQIKSGSESEERVIIVQ